MQSTIIAAKHQSTALPTLSTEPWRRGDGCRKEVEPYLSIVVDM